MVSTGVRSCYAGRPCLRVYDLGDTTFAASASRAFVLAPCKGIRKRYLEGLLVAESHWEIQQGDTGNRDNREQPGGRYSLQALHQWLKRTVH